MGMGKKKETANRDRFNEAEAEAPHEDPVIKNWLKKVAEQESAAALAPTGPMRLVGLSAQIEQFEATALKARCRDLEIRNKELELGLYQAKAKICEFELANLKKET
jgi:hypothetical protein